MRIPIKRNQLLIICFLLILANTQTAWAQIAETDLEQLCEKIEDLYIPDAFILSASVVPAENDVPEHCLVLGYTLSANHFMVRLPINDWNEKFFLGGCGGGCGRLPVELTGSLLNAIQRGYAIATMNAGHRGTNYFDLQWAYQNREAEIDFAYQAVHETVLVGKRVVEEFYNQSPAHSYFQGCSNGGRQGLTEVTSFPEDFDGIITEGAGLNFRNGFLLYAWVQQKNIGEDGKDIIKPADLPIIAQAVYADCDAMDGQEDGLISDPRKCQFDPESLLCDSEGQEGCLSRQQVEVLKAWYEGPKDSAGKPLLPYGVNVGSEPFWVWFVGETDNLNDDFIQTVDWFKYVLFNEDPGESYSLTDFNFDTDPAKLDEMGELLKADNPDLDAFRKSGGKLLMYQGWSDPVIAYDSHLAYYGAVEKRFGGKEQTQDFFRLFMVPGMDHCTVLTNLGITHDSVDPLTALEKWVEEGEAPDELPVTRFDAQGEVQSRFSVAPFSEDSE